MIQLVWLRSSRKGLITKESSAVRTYPLTCQIKAFDTLSLEAIEKMLEILGIRSALHRNGHVDVHAG